MVAFILSFIIPELFFFYPPPHPPQPPSLHLGIETIIKRAPRLAKAFSLFPSAQLTASSGTATAPPSTQCGTRFPIVVNFLSSQRHSEDHGKENMNDQGTSSTPSIFWFMGFYQKFMDMYGFIHLCHSSPGPVVTGDQHNELEEEVEQSLDHGNSVESQQSSADIGHSLTGDIIFSFPQLNTSRALRLSSGDCRSSSNRNW